MYRSPIRDVGPRTINGIFPGKMVEDILQEVPQRAPPPLLSVVRAIPDIVKPWAEKDHNKSYHIPHTITEDIYICSVDKLCHGFLWHCVHSECCGRGAGPICHRTGWGKSILGMAGHSDIVKLSPALLGYICMAWSMAWSMVCHTECLPSLQPATEGWVYNVIITT